MKKNYSSSKNSNFKKTAMAVKVMLLSAMLFAYAGVKNNAFAQATIGLTSTVGTDNQAICNNTAIQDITYLVDGIYGTGAGVTGLPPGLVGSFSTGVFTINGISTVSGTYSYTITTTGIGVQTSTSGSIIVNPTPSVTNAPTNSVCSSGTTYIVLAADIPSTFTWGLGTVTGDITGAGEGAEPIISQLLTNPSDSSSGTVEYNIYASSNSCSSSSYTITVTVNTAPTITCIGNRTVSTDAGLCTAFVIYGA